MASDFSMKLLLGKKIRASRLGSPMFDTLLYEKIIYKD
jgi:hypothetical protein